MLAVVESNQGNDPVNVVAALLALLASVTSWALVNTVFAFKYARLRYLDPDGGIDFKQQDPPTYSDFAYLAFTWDGLRRGRHRVLLAVAINVVPILGGRAEYACPRRPMSTCRAEHLSTRRRSAPVLRGSEARSGGGRGELAAGAGDVLAPRVPDGGGDAGGTQPLDELLLHPGT